MYDEMKEKNEIDADDDSMESSAKNLSLKLLGTTDAGEVLNIFESEIIRKPQKKLHGEELCLVLKFLQHAIQ